MSGFLARLGAQAFGVVSAVTPRRPAPFVPPEGPIGDIAAQPVDAIEPPSDPLIEQPPDTVGRDRARSSAPVGDRARAEVSGRERRSASVDQLSAFLPQPPVLTPIAADVQTVGRGGILDGSGSMGRVVHASAPVEQRDSAPRRNPVRVLTKGAAERAEVVAANALGPHDEASAVEPGQRHPLQPRQTAGTPRSPFSPPSDPAQNAAGGLAEDAAPIVEVHIGRIDVVAGTPAPSTRAQARARGIPTLAEYLGNARQR